MANKLMGHRVGYVVRNNLESHAQKELITKVSSSMRNSIAFMITMKSAVAFDILAHTQDSTGYALCRN